MSDDWKRYQEARRVAEEGATVTERAAAREIMRQLEEDYPELAQPIPGQVYKNHITLSNGITLSFPDSGITVTPRFGKCIVEE